MNAITRMLYAPAPSGNLACRFCNEELTRLQAAHALTNLRSLTVAGCCAGQELRVVEFLDAMEAAR